MAVSLRSQDGKRITNSPNAAAKNSGAISERSFSEKNCKEFEVIIIYSRGHQVRSWRAGVPAEFSSNPNQTHLKQLIKVLLGILETSRQVCWGKLELNSAGHRPSRIKFDDPWSTVHNIIQRFRESGTISVRKGQGPENHTGCRWSSALFTALHHIQECYCNGKSQHGLRNTSRKHCRWTQSTVPFAVAG